MELDKVADAVSAPLSVSGTERVVLQTGVGDTAKPDLANDPRLAKFNLTAYCDEESPVRDQIHGKQVVLRNGKFYLDEPDHTRRRFPDGHPFCGFYLEYAFEHKPPPMGLVSTISEDPPLLNWVYIDKDTLELKYGNRKQSAPHIVGPWDWTDDQQSVTLEGWEGFVAVEENGGVWVLCYDRQDDGLGALKGDRRILECSLERSMVKK